MMLKFAINHLKHSLVVILILITAIFAAACQPTPEKPVITQKDTVEKAIESLPSQTQAYTPPQTWQDVLTDEATGYTVKIDADIICPAYDHFNIYNIRPKNFTQKEVDSIVNYFVGAKTLYNGEYVETKQDVEDKIVDVKHLLTLSQKDRDDLFGGITESELQQQLKDLQERYKKTPEKVDKQTIATTLTKDKDGYEVLETYVDNGGSNDALITVYNLAEESNDAMFQVRIRDASKGGCIFPSTGTPEEIAQRILDDLGIDHTQIVSTGPVTTSQDPSEIKTVTRIQYELTVDGLPLRNTCHIFAPEEMEFATPFWRADMIGIDIGDNGPTDFYWSGHGNITGTVKENVALMPFEDIMEAFRNNIFHSAVWPTQELIKEKNVEVYPIVITRIDLCMAAVSQKDAPGEYLLVPVWNFYGYMDYPENEFGMQRKPSILMETLMTISAVDGTMLHR